MTFFDKGDLTPILSIQKENAFDGTKVINIYFKNRNDFNNFDDFIKGYVPSWLEDDHNLFDLSPFVEDIGYSDMVVKLEAEGLYL